jgi:hypothetical protein
MSTSQAIVSALRALIGSPWDPSDADHREGAFSRLRGALGESLYRKARRLVVELVGTSRNGMLAAQYLASLGIRALRLWDPDILTVANTDTMPGVDIQFVGQPKPLAVADVLLKQRPEMAITCIQAPALDLEGAPGCDAIVTCVDDEVARAAATIRAQRLLVPHLDIATTVQADGGGGRRVFGDARLFIPGEGCALCVPPPAAATLQEILYHLAAPPGTLRRGVPRTWDEQRAGSLVTINAMTVAAGMASLMDLLEGTLRSSFWQRLDWVPGRGLEVHSAAVGSDAHCPFCGIGGVHA